VVGPNFLVVELDRLKLSGGMEPGPEGTTIALSRSRPTPWWIDKLIVPSMFLSGFVLVGWRPGDSPTPPVACLFLTLGIVTVREWRGWRRFDNSSLDADEAVRIIANLVLACEARTLGGDPKAIPLAREPSRQT
jgi:hypothetical protein